MNREEKIKRVDISLLRLNNPCSGTSPHILLNISACLTFTYILTVFQTIIFRSDVSSSERRNKKSQLTFKFKGGIMKSLIMLSFCVALFLGGCATTADIYPYSSPLSGEEQQSKGILFSLPKNILHVKITYSLYQHYTFSNNGLVAGERFVRVVKPMEVSNNIVPDDNERFVFDNESVGGFLKSSEASIKLTPEGLIKSTNIKIEDKSKEIASAVIKTGIAIGKIAALGMAEGGKDSLIQEVSVDRFIDVGPNQFTPAGDFLGSNFVYDDSRYSLPLFNDVEKITKENFEKVNIILHSSSNALPQSLHATQKLSSPLHGFPYRSAAPIHVVITVHGKNVYEKYHNFPQLGGIAILPVTSKVFTDLNNGVVFTDDGNLAEYSSTTSSQGANIASALQEGSEAIFSGIKDIKQAQTDMLNLDTALNNAYRDNIKSLQARLEAELVKNKANAKDSTGPIAGNNGNPNQ